jgi:hypothetical protein
MLMNGPFVREQAQAFAGRVRAEAGAGPAAQVRHAWRLAFAREPAAGEVAEAVAFLAEQARNFPANPQEMALASFCQALLSANPFLYVE